MRSTHHHELALLLASLPRMVSYPILHGLREAVLGRISEMVSRMGKRQGSSHIYTRKELPEGMGASLDAMVDGLLFNELQRRRSFLPMIRVTIELIPGGMENHPRRRVLGTLEIANDNTGTADIGNYTATLHAEYTGPDGRKGRIQNFRRQRQSAWSLVGAALKLFGHTKHSVKPIEQQTELWKQNDS